MPLMWKRVLCQQEGLTLEDPLTRQGGLKSTLENQFALFELELSRKSLPVVLDIMKKLTLEE